MAEELDLKKLVDDKEPEFTPLVGRMSADEDTYFMTPYKLLDFAGNPLPKVVSTTLNDPATFAHRSIAILASADPQVVVESDTLNPTQEQAVEQFIPALEYETDSMMANRVMGISFPFFCEQACIRGWLAGMCLLREDKKTGRLIPDRRPLDSKFVRYEAGMNGLEWASYRSTRSALKIKQEYGHNIYPEEKAEVLNIFSRTRNHVWIGETKVKDQAHPYKINGEGYVPFVIQPIPAGSMLQGPNMIMHQGESIFALDRQLYPKMNEMASVLENLTMASFFSSKQYASEAGEAAEQPEALPFGLGVIVSVEKGGGYTLIPVADIRNATRLLYSIYENRIQRGSLPNIDYGNLTFPLSAVAISRLTEAKDTIFVPRLQGLAMFYQQWDKMAINQYIGIGKNLRLGQEGTRKVFPVAGLKGEYAIKRKYYSVSPEQDIANIAQASQIPPRLMSMHTIRRQVLKLKDPDGEEDLLGIEEAEQLNPVLKLRRQAIRLVNKEQMFDAELVLQSAEDLLRQRAMGQAITRLPEQPAKEQQPKSLMPLMEGGGGGQPRGKSEEEKVGEEMEEEERIGRLAETARAGRRQEA